MDAACASRCELQMHHIPFFFKVRSMHMRMHMHMHTHASVHALHIVPFHMFPHFFRSLRSTRACNHMHMHACES